MASATVLPPAAPTVLAQMYPPRPGYGKLGRVTQVEVNHFHVEQVKTNDVYHYDVQYAKEGEKFKNEDGLSKAVCETLLKLVLQRRELIFPNICIVSDGRKNVFTTKPLPESLIVINDVILPDEETNPNPKKFTVQLKAASPISVRMEQLQDFFNRRINYTPYDCIQALDVALRHTSAQRYIGIGRNFFHSDGARQIVNGADIWFGFHQSLRPTQSGLTLNIDTAATAFVRSMPALNYLCEVLGRRDIPRELSPHDISIASRAFRGIKVRITHRGNIKRAYRVNGLTKESADRLSFELEEGRKVTVEKFFEQKYKKLNYPNLPCLDVGGPSKTNYLPLETCHTMEGQKLPRKLTDRQVDEMIKVTCLRPSDRKKRIETRLLHCDFGKDANLAAFGLKVDSHMITADARILPPPELVYGPKQIQCTLGGAWNMKGKVFYQPRALDSMAVISCTEHLSKERIKNFLDKMFSMMRDLSMTPPKSLPPLVVQRHNVEFSDCYDQAIRLARKQFGKEPQIVFVIKPTPDAHAYGEIKRCSDTKYGIVSQCLLAKHIGNANVQYISNVLMKVNVKLGGKNTVVHRNLPCISQAPTIIFGADVTHPSPTDESKPSVAAVVASVDPFGVYYYAAIRKQGHRVEQIEDLKNMSISLFRRFYAETRRKPARIIFYRDGVSEGQFAMVLNHEIAALRSACLSLEKDYCPPITFIVVQKRHHTRMFPLNQRDADRSGNCAPGTIIEKTICHPNEYDFYLMSHCGIQGTSRPTHYHVLLDENHFSVDDLQSTTYKLCYTFARCTRSVSIVPAAYYAHLVAFRARFFLKDSSDDGSVSTRSRRDSPESCRMVTVHQKLDRIMYYV